MFENFNALVKKVESMERKHKKKDLSIKLTDKELIKWISILGSYRMKELYFMNKINLSKDQLDKLIEIGRKEIEESNEKFIEEYSKTLEIIPKNIPLGSIYQSLKDCYNLCVPDTSYYHSIKTIYEEL